MSSITTRRSLTYWMFFGLFLLAGGPILSFDLLIDAFIHNILDGVGLLSAIVAAGFSVVAYRRTGATALAIVSMALAGTVVFEALHELADTRLLATFMTSTPDTFMPWSWHASRVFLGIGLLAAALHATKDNFGTEKTVGRSSFPTPVMFAVFAVITVVAGSIALLQADLPSIYYSSVGYIRLPEIVSGAILLIALLVSIRFGNWRTDSYGHWMNVGMVAAVNAQFFCMAFSQQFLDSSFAAAHLLKIISYGCLIFGFARSHRATSAARDVELNKPRGLSLGIKVALLCGFIGFICVMPIAIKSSQTLHQIAATNGMEKLSAATSATQAAMQEQRERVDANLDYLASTKLMAGLNRALQGDGIDIESGRNTQELIVEISRLAQNLLYSDAAYLSLAYFDARTGEAVFRSEQRLGNGAAALNRNALLASEQTLAEQSIANGKGASRARSPIFALGEGVAEGERPAKIEGTALGVYAIESGNLQGTLVLHSDVAELLAGSGLPGIETLAYVVNGNGEFLRHPDASRELTASGSAYTLADEFAGLDFAALAQSRMERSVEQTEPLFFERADGTEVIVGFYGPIVTVGSGESLLFIEAGNREDLEQTATAIGYDLQRIAQINLLFAIAFGWFFARRFARPVQEISAAAVEFGRSGKVADLPMEGRDEIGLLGKSLSEMMSEVASQREKLLLLSSAVESSVDSTIITTIQGTVEYVNPHYELYAGVKAADVLGKNIMELQEFKQNRNILSEKPSEKGGEKIWTGEMRMLRADGQMHDELVTISPIRNAAGENINQSMIIEDVTERRAMEKYIEGKTAELQRSNRDLEQFAYVASHDLKAPLRAIEVLVSWLKDDLEDYQDGDVQENLDLLRRRTERLSRLLDDLLAYSRAGRKIGDVKIIDTHDFVEDIAQLISPPEGFTIEVDKDMPAITTYHAPLETVFRNLISNAIKHSPEPSAGRVRVYAEDRGERVEFVVEDNGSGIDQEYAEKVFKMFQTLQARDEKEGSGMGLAIVQRIIDWQGGKIWFHDGPNGQGTVFRFTWMKQPKEQPNIPEIQAQEEAAEDMMSQTQILRIQAEQESQAERDALYGGEDYTEQAPDESADEVRPQAGSKTVDTPDQ